jgi:hypothetical protein
VYDLDAGLQGYNLFVYCGNNPINRIDISGTDSAELDDLDAVEPELSERGGSGSGFSCGGGYANAYNPIDAGYHYSIDMSQAANSSSFSGGLFSNGYVSYYYHANPNSANNGSNSHEGNPLYGISYTSKVLGQIQGPDFHGFPLLVDNYGKHGELSVNQGKDGQMYTHLRIPGSYLGYDGYFHYIWDSRGICNHRMFVKK